MPEFVHLHVHSEFSLLDGANRKYIKRKLIDNAKDVVYNIAVLDTKMSKNLKHN